MAIIARAITLKRPTKTRIAIVLVIRRLVVTASMRVQKIDGTRGRDNTKSTKTDNNKTDNTTSDHCCCRYNCYCCSASRVLLQGRKMETKRIRSRKASGKCSRPAGPLNRVHLLAHSDSFI